MTQLNIMSLAIRSKVKDNLVEIITKEGYDFITACEMADKCIHEFKVSGRNEETYVIGSTQFTIKRGKTRSIF